MSAKKSFVNIRTLECSNATTQRKYFYMSERTHIPRRCKLELLKLLSRCTTSMWKRHRRYLPLSTSHLSGLTAKNFARCSHMTQDLNIRFESARVLVTSVASCPTPFSRMLLTLTGARIRPYAQLLRWILLIILDFVVKSGSYFVTRILRAKR